LSLNSHLARQGNIARGGQILDASITRQVIAGNHREGIVPVPRNHNTREENAAIKGGEEPEGWENKPAKRSQKDVDAPLSGIQGMPCRARDGRRNTAKATVATRTM
jgi:hypothetical protein